MNFAEEIAFVVSCEHGGHRIPDRFRALLPQPEPLLFTHCGYDRGALRLAREMADALQAPLIPAVTSRLLVDLNRSPGNRALFSEPVRRAPPELRAQILQDCYRPYRARVEAEVAARIAHGKRVVHLSSHSFTPMLHGVVRNADVGLLYDPRRPAELAFCRAWQAALAAAAPQLRVRRNYPYTGNSDGLCTALRRRFAQADYLGIELEINQKHAATGGAGWRALRGTVIATLLETRAGLAKQGGVGV